MHHPGFVGILINAPLYKHIPAGKTGYERLEFYEEACSEFNMRPCYLKLSDLLHSGKHLQAYVKVKGSYRKIQVPKPLVIHNRALYRSPAANRKIALLKKKGYLLFNKRNRYNKLTVHRLLMEDPSFIPHLPETLPANPDTIKSMQQKYPSFFLKPQSGSVGSGIMTVRLSGKGSWELFYPKGKGKTGHIHFQKTLPSYLKKKLKSEAYLVQQHLPLATYQGCPYDLRVSVQRDETGDWQVTGIAAKVARRGAYLTNVAQGGRVFTLDSLLANVPAPQVDEVKRRVTELSLRIARHLSGRLLDLADLGLDIGVTEEGFPMFIEANGRDQRYSFREAGMMAEWKKTYRNPIAYAHFLSKI